MIRKEGGGRGGLCRGGDAGNSRVVMIKEGRVVVAADIATMVV